MNCRIFFITKDALSAFTPSSPSHPLSVRMFYEHTLFSFLLLLFLNPSLFLPNSLCKATSWLICLCMCACVSVCVECVWSVCLCVCVCGVCVECVCHKCQMCNNMGYNRVIPLCDLNVMKCIFCWFFLLRSKDS